MFLLPPQKIKRKVLRRQLIPLIFLISVLHQVIHLKLINFLQVAHALFFQDCIIAPFATSQLTRKANSKHIRRVRSINPSLLLQKLRNHLLRPRMILGKRVQLKMRMEARALVWFQWRQNLIRSNCHLIWCILIFSCFSAHWHLLCLIMHFDYLIIALNVLIHYEQQLLSYWLLSFFCHLNWISNKKVLLYKHTY